MPFFFPAPIKPVVENASSPESEEAQDEDTALRERIALTQQGPHSPKTRRMQMRISYAETDGEGKSVLNSFSCKFKGLTLLLLTIHCVEILVVHQTLKYFAFHSPLYA